MSESDVNMSQDENKSDKSDDTTPTGPEKKEPFKTGLKPPTNFHALLLNRNKKPLAAKNAASQVPSTPSNIKRLQVNKWFNSPTDNMFSPCTKKLYKKNGPVATCNLNADLNFEEDSLDENVSSSETVQNETQQQ